MIYIVHGEDTPKSRALITNHQKKLEESEKISLNIKNVTAEQIYEHCVSNSLFGESPLVVVDITDYKKSENDNYIEKFSKIPEATTLILYSSKLLPKTNAILKAADQINAKVIENNVFSDANVFKFTDALFSKNRVQAYKELHKLTSKGEDPFYIFSMVLYGLRLLAKVIWNAPSAGALKPFQTSKIRGQLSSFTAQAIQKLFTDFYQLDKKTKTGEITSELMLTLAVEKVLNSV